MRAYLSLKYSWVKPYFEKFIFYLISVNVVLFILETVEELDQMFGIYFAAIEYLSLLFFTLEYFAGIFFRGRKYTFSFIGFVDLVTILPLFIPVLGWDLRILRLFRLFRLLKLSKYFKSLEMIGRVFEKKKFELMSSMVFLSILMIFSSSAMYYIERIAQPEVFKSIPHTMWWAVATLTTVGYGDIYPVTLLGKIIATIMAILGIGFCALPTSILVAGFNEEIGNKSD